MLKVDKGNLGRSQRGVVEYRISFSYESKEPEVLERVDRAQAEKRKILWMRICKRGEDPNQASKSISRTSW